MGAINWGTDRSDEERGSESTKIAKDYLLGSQPHGDPLHDRARGIIERQVTQLTRLVDDLMDVSRVSIGRVHL